MQGEINQAAGSGALEAVERSVLVASRWLELGMETIGALVILIGVVLSVYRFFLHFRDERPVNFNRVRLTLGKYLALALEFQLGADILATAIAPTWELIGKLGAIAAIRTVLNYFLSKEIEAEQRREEENRERGAAGAEKTE